MFHQTFTEDDQRALEDSSERVFDTTTLTFASSSLAPVTEQNCLTFSF